MKTIFLRSLLHIRTHLRVPREAVAEEAFIVGGDRVRCYVERFVEQLEVGHIVTHVGHGALIAAARLPPGRQRRYN